MSPTFFINCRSSIRIMDFVWLMSRRRRSRVHHRDVGCHFGLRTTGGTEGVGLSTTRTVVAVSIAILIAIPC
ncbi:MAG: ABC transporter permease [Labilithrix sp.]|nr:ABC transporter permease [Labilithrix sp.]